jgi:hypothetical protein
MVILHSFNILKRNCSEERGPRKSSNFRNKIGQENVKSVQSRDPAREIQERKE